MTAFPLSASRWTILVLFVLLSACTEGVSFDVEKGSYEAQLEGSIVDTLSGSAVYRTFDGGGSGLELGRRRGPGLSIEINTDRLEPGTYQVMPASVYEEARTDSIPGVMAFLSVDEARFEATQGTISLSYVGEKEVRGTLDLEMKGSGIDGGDDLSIRVTGNVWAATE